MQFWISFSIKDLTHAYQKVTELASEATTKCTYTSIRETLSVLNCTQFKMPGEVKMTSNKTNSQPAVYSDWSDLYNAMGGPEEATSDHPGQLPQAQEPSPPLEARKQQIQAENSFAGQTTSD